MQAKPRWIERDVGKLRAQEAHTVALESAKRALARVERLQSKLDGIHPTMAFVGLSAQGSPEAWLSKAPLETWDQPPPPTPAQRRQSLLAELRRLGDGTPQHWHSLARTELLALGWIKITHREDGRWNGDQITGSGLKALAEETVPSASASTSPRTSG